MGRLPDIIPRVVLGVGMEDGKIFVEKRTDARYGVQLPVKFGRVEDKKELQFVLEHYQKEEEAVAQDISLGGLKISMEQPMREGEILVFEIPLPDISESLSACAEVVWVDGTTIGLRFRLIDELDLIALKVYLKKLGPKP